MGGEQWGRAQLCIGLSGMAWASSGEGRGLEARYLLLIKSPVSTKSTLRFKCLWSIPRSPQQKVCILLFLYGHYLVFHFAHDRTTFPSSENDSNLNDVDAAASVFFPLVCMWLQVCSALVLFLALCTGLICESLGCQHKKKWNREEAAHTCKRGAPYPWEPDPTWPLSPVLLLKQKDSVAVQLPFESGSLNLLACSASRAELSTRVKTDIPGVLVVVFPSSLFAKMA